jgi:hypothetical protein
MAALAGCFFNTLLALAADSVARQAGRDKASALPKPQRPRLFAAVVIHSYRIWRACMSGTVFFAFLILLRLRRGFGGFGGFGGFRRDRMRHLIEQAGRARLLFG